MGSTAAQSLEVTAVFAGSRRLPVSVSTIEPFCRFGESAEDVLVTTIVHVSAAPTLTGSGAQVLVTPTPGWNRLVSSLASAVAVWSPTV